MTNSLETQSPQAGPRHFKRKKLNLNVKREFQKWLLLRILGTVILSSLVAGTILYFYARHETTASFYEAHIKIIRVSDLLLPVVAAGSFVSLIGGALLALFLPQKVAGPIFRIEQDLRNVEGGDLTVEVKLRKGDPLKDLAATINRTIASLRSKIHKVKEARTNVEKALSADDKEILIESMETEKETLNVFHT